MKTLTGNRVIPRSIKNNSGTNTIALDLLLNQNCITTNNGNLIITGNISGNFGLYISGSGTTELKGNNTYLGDTVIRSGTLKIAEIGNFGTNGTYSGFILNNGTFDYSSSSDIIFSGVIGTLSKTLISQFNANSKFSINGTGRLVWNFDRLSSFFDGKIELNNGYFRIGNGSNNGGTLYLKEIQIGSSGNLEFNRNDNYDGDQSVVLSGSGNIVLMDGSLGLTGINTFDGTFTINSSKTLTLKRKNNCNFVNNGILILNVTEDYSYWDTSLANFSKTYDNNQSNYVLSTDYTVSTNSGSGDVTAQIQSAGFGDNVSEFSGFVSGRIALVQRNSTSFQTKVNNAIAAGASAVIIYNNTTGLFTPSLTSSNIPVIGVTQSIGQQIITDLGNGIVTVNIKCPPNFGLFSNTISGDGSLTKSGVGVLAMDSNNSYSGATAINNGVLRILNSNALGNSSSVTIGSTSCLEISGGISFDRSLNIGGTGSNSTGAVRNISNSNTHNGSVVMTANSRINCNAGTFTIGSSGSFTGNFGVTFGGSGDIVVNKTLANSTVTKDGSGTLIFNATNSYTSTTTVSAGTLKINGSGTFGSGTVTNNSFIVFETDNNSTILNNISGSGTITKNLNTKIIFTGTLSHTGATNVNAGTLAIGSGGTTGDFSGSTGNIVVNSGAALEINRNNAYTLARNISGQGLFLISGSGTTSITGNLTHTGGTTINSGALSVGTGGTTGSISGSIENNSSLIVNKTNDLSYSDVISGTGTLTKSNTGRLILSANNTFTGNTIFSGGGGPIRISHANALGNSSATISILSSCAVELTNGIIFSRNLSSAGTGVSSGGSLRSISGNNKFNGSYAMTAASRISCDADTLTIEGGTSGAFALVVGGAGNTVISGSMAHGGSFSKDGSGSLIISNNNTYTGSTFISGGPVTVSATSSSPFGSGTSVQVNSSLIIEMNDGSTISQSISGTGSLVKNLNTKIIFTGTLSHTGTTTISAGTLALGAGGTTGAASGTGTYIINSGSILEINRSNDSTFSRSASGEGSVVITGGGIASISGDLNHTGGTTINSGTLSIGVSAGATGSISGNIVNNGTLRFNRGNQFAYSGSISGTGAVTKESTAGIVILSGNSSYTGNTLINAGIMRISSSNALGNSASVRTSSGATLELINGVTIANNIVLNGSGVSSGGALRSVSGNNTVSGSISHAGSCPRINCDADVLTLDGNGTLNIACDITIGGAGTILLNRTNSNNGRLTKDGSGSLIFLASNTHTGATTISAGMIRYGRASSLYNGATASWTKTNIIVNSGATFAINVGGANEFTTSNITTLLTNLLTAINNNGLRSGSFIGFDTTNSSSDFTISNNITDSTGTGSGAVGVTKLGTGTLVLSGTSTYTGATTVNTGTLKAGSNSCFGTSTITVNSGATLDKAGFNITNTIVNNSGTVID